MDNSVYNLLFFKRNVKHYRKNRTNRSSHDLHAKIISSNLDFVASMFRMTWQRSLAYLLTCVIKKMISRWTAGMTLGTPTTFMAIIHIRFTVRYSCRYVPIFWWMQEWKIHLNDKLPIVDWYQNEDDMQMRKSLSLFHLASEVLCLSSALLLGNISR